MPLLFFYRKEFLMNYTYAEIGLINGSTLWVDVSGPPRASTCDFCQKKEALTFGIGPTDDLTTSGGVNTICVECVIAQTQIKFESIDAKGYTDVEAYLATMRTIDKRMRSRFETIVQTLRDPELDQNDVPEALEDLVAAQEALAAIGQAELYLDLEVEQDNVARRALEGNIHAG